MLMMFGRRDGSRMGDVLNQFRFESLEELSFPRDGLAGVGFDSCRNSESGGGEVEGTRKDIKFGEFEVLHLLG
jgi:hypothetical protein